MWSGAEPSQRAFDRGPDVGGAAVDNAGSAAGLGDEPERGRQHHLVAAALGGAPNDFLAVERSVDLGGVDVGDAQLERPVDGPDRFGVVQAAAAGIRAGHGHGTEADPGGVPVHRERCASSMSPCRSRSRRGHCLVGGALLQNHARDAGGSP
jgi:hypothetical protein